MSPISGAPANCRAGRSATPPAPIQRGEAEDRVRRPVARDWEFTGGRGRQPEPAWRLPTWRGDHSLLPQSCRQEGGRGRCHCSAAGRGAHVLRLAGTVSHAGGPARVRAGGRALDMTCCPRHCGGAARPGGLRLRGSSHDRRRGGRGCVRRGLGGGARGLLRSLGDRRRCRRDRLCNSRDGLRHGLGRLGGGLRHGLGGCRRPVTGLAVAAALATGLWRWRWPA